LLTPGFVIANPRPVIASVAEQSNPPRATSHNPFSATSRGLTAGSHIANDKFL
jgi:hypothetical protein